MHKNKNLKAVITDTKRFYITPTWWLSMRTFRYPRNLQPVLDLKFSYAKANATELEEGVAIGPTVQPASDLLDSI